MPPTPKARLLGAHVSAGQTNHFGIDRARELGINCAQIFGANKVQWKPRAYREDQVASFRSARAGASITPIFSHGIYLINLGAREDNPDVYEKSVQALAAGLKICDLLGLDGLIFHLGSNYGQGISGVLDSVVSGLARARELAECEVPLVLENSAGSERVIGGRFTDFEVIIAELHGDPRIQICIDTAHAFAFGYDLAQPDGTERLVAEIEAAIGFERVSAIHLNDSKVECGGALDRHANLGEGHIGYRGLAEVLGHPRIKRLPIIMETPGFDGNGPDRGNVEIMRSLAGELDVEPEILARRARQRASYRRWRAELAGRRKASKSRGAAAGRRGRGVK
ncbi:MAG: deoxyribonuclease IV [Chloroflexota bacterium]|nr:deoxyribonuclease IV [Chloroflexota bacterium]MDP6756659.1 deoxyribonuclease IV [Chloroflexota bacterium]